MPRHKAKVSNRKPEYAGGRQAPLFMPDSEWMPPASLPSLKGIKHLVFDTETRDEGLSEFGPGVRRDPSKNYIAGIAIQLELDGPKMYIPVRHEGGGNLDETIVKRWAKRELSNFDGSLYGAHLLYDLDWIGAPAWDVQFKNVKEFHDVQVAEPLIDEWRYSYALDDISKDYLGVGKDEALLRQAAERYGFKGTDIKKNLWRLPAQFVGAYAEGDLDRPARIFPLQQKKLEAEGLLGIYDIERRLIPILLGMRQRGVRIDKRRADEVRSILMKRRDESIDNLRKLAGPQAQLNIPESFVGALRERGLEVPITRKTKKPSIKRPWLELHEEDPLVHAIADGRKCSTIISFIESYVSFATGSTGDRIHCEFNQLKNEDGRGTIARFSSSNPNLQNVSARDEIISPLVRSIFLPEEGEDWQRDDYSQIEYRILVNYAVGGGAEEAREKYRNDPKTDYHKFVAVMLNVDPEDKIKRKRVKNTNFAKGYGAQAKKLAETFRCSIEEAMSFIQEYEAALPFTVKTFDAAQTWAARRGFVTTILGRKARFPLWEPIGAKGNDKEGERPPAFPYELALEKYGPRIKRAGCYKALNRKIQGSAADMMKKAMVDAHDAGVFSPDALGWPLITVHDELDCSVPRTARGAEAGRELTRIMEEATPLMGPRGLGPRIPVLVESERGINWGECK